MTRRGILFVISGPSGVGKGTIKDALLAQITEIKVSISATTRSPRVGEIDGNDYFFITEKKFQHLIEQGEFLEWAQVYSNMYGTPKRFVQHSLNQGHDVLLEIDIQGALQVKNTMPQGVFIFIAPPSMEELASRLCSRGKDSQDSIEKRLAGCQEEMSHKKDYDYLVVNDDIDQAVEKVKSIIIAERCRVKNLDLG